MSRPTTPSEVVAISVKAGALPCTLLSVIGDFFSPKGFWLLPLASGIAALVLAAAFGKFKPLRERILSGFFGTERARFWETPFMWSAASCAMLTFGVVGIVFGCMSQQHRQNGGVLADSMSVVSSLQQLVGVSSASLEEQRKTRQATESLVQLGRTGIAEDPRVTLSNQGVAWSEDSFSEALSSGDVDVVQLFLSGGMRFDHGSLGLAFKYLTPELAKVITEHSDLVPTEACVPSYESMGVEVKSLRVLDGFLRDRDWKLDPKRVKLYAAICDKPEIRSLLGDLAQNGGAGANGVYDALRKAFPTTASSPK